MMPVPSDVRVWLAVGRTGLPAQSSIGACRWTGRQPFAGEHGGYGAGEPVGAQPRNDRSICLRIAAPYSRAIFPAKSKAASTDIWAVSR